MGWSQYIWYDIKNELAYKPEYSYLYDDNKDMFVCELRDFHKRNPTYRILEMVALTNNTNCMMIKYIDLCELSYAVVLHDKGYSVIGNKNGMEEEDIIAKFKKERRYE